MRRIISLLIVAVLWWSLFDDLLFAQRQQSKTEDETETKVIDLTADIVYPITLNDTVEVMCLVGDFAAQHNGAIITADSAVRYSDKRLECFGNVLINKNTTYAYADRADYNGELNEVQLYAPIVKVIDGEATLYCYNFRFNTLDNIGVYDGGGVMLNGESVMESVTGYYYSDTKELIGVGDVQLSGDEYQMTSDSIIYNTETEAAQYFLNTNIWNQKDEYLYADAGDYDKALDRYSFSLNGYILTDEQEMWSDSMDYFRASEHIYMRQNIQIDDTTQKSLIFGNYGEYIKSPGDMILVGRPSIINYDLEQGDSLFMRADTFEIFTLKRSFEVDSTQVAPAITMMDGELGGGALPPLGVPNEMDESHAGHNHAEHNHNHDSQGSHPHEGENNPESATRATREQDAEAQKRPFADGPIGVPRQEQEAAALGAKDEAGDEAATRSEEESSSDLIATDSLAVDSLAVDSLAVDSLKVDSLRRDSLKVKPTIFNLWSRKKAEFLAAQKKRATERAVEDAAKKVILDSIGQARQIVINKKLDAEKVREARQIAQRKAKIAEKQAKKLRRDVARGKVAAEDTVAMMSAIAIDTTALIRELANIDTTAIGTITVDSLAQADSLAQDSVQVDSLYRLTKGYRNVKIFRSDFQAIADSMTTTSIDSIIKLYHDPVLWHENNQVTSDLMDIYTDNNQIRKAIFTGGTPIMASEVEQRLQYYNQIAGKVITSLFAEGQIYRTDADGNAQTIYFMQDEESQKIDGLMLMQSGAATFYIEDQEMVGITYKGDPEYILYPMNMIPADQSLTLKGFSWQREKRPTQQEVFDRTIRPSIREEKSAIPRPTFPLQEALEANKKELIEFGLWRERNDIVKPQIEEWMESLGYKTGQPREEATDD